MFWWLRKRQRAGRLKFAIFDIWGVLRNERDGKWLMQKLRTERRMGRELYLRAGWLPCPARASSDAAAVSVEDGLAVLWWWGCRTTVSLSCPASCPIWSESSVKDLPYCCSITLHRERIGG